MDTLTALLADGGNWGMLFAAFLAGSLVPFSSETVMAALWAAGEDPYQLVLYGTVGNTLGSMLNYTIGSFGRLDRLARLHVSDGRLARAKRFAEGKGALVGFFCFLPVLGSAIAVALGLARANLPLTILSVAAGKFLRYWLLIFGLSHIIAPFFQ